MIPSLFDSSIQKTVEDCLQQAKYPDRITFGLSLQGVDNVDFSHIKNEKKIITLEKNIVYGIGKTRYQLQQLYNNEDYILSIDCHTGFSKDWDESLIKQHELIGNEKGVITQFLCERFMSHCTKTKYVYSETYVWGMEYVHQSDPEFIKNRNLWQRVAPHFIFATREFAKIPYPYMYFFGDEDDILSIKLFCNGFDMYELENTYLTTLPKNSKDCSDRTNWFLSAVNKYQKKYKYTLSENIDSPLAANIAYPSEDALLSNHLLYFGTQTMIDTQLETAKLFKEGFNDILMEDFRDTPRSIKDFFSFHNIDENKIKSKIDKHYE